jgi:hypothetical protein
MLTGELRHRDAVLFWTGAIMLLVLVVITLISIGDNRQILGLNPWIKPMKFLTSITIFLWTMAWFMPETRLRERGRALLRWTIVAVFAIEMAIIIMQSARGTTSHFNVSTPFDAAMFNIMGLAIIVNTVVVGVFLWMLRRDTPPNRAGYLWGIRTGLVVFILGSLQGFMMVANMGHAVPGPDGGPGLPFVNWSTEGGDLRAAHFLGMHALQALPLLGFLLDRARVAAARNLVVGVSILWLALVGGLVVMAFNGRPLIAL